MKLYRKNNQTLAITMMIALAFAGCTNEVPSISTQPVAESSPTGIDQADSDTNQGGSQNEAATGLTTIVIDQEVLDELALSAGLHLAYGSNDNNDDPLSDIGPKDDTVVALVAVAAAGAILFGGYRLFRSADNVARNATPPTIPGTRVVNAGADGVPTQFDATKFGKLSDNAAAVEFDNLKNGPDEDLKKFLDGKELDNAYASGNNKMYFLKKRKNPVPGLRQLYTEAIVEPATGLSPYRLIISDGTDRGITDAAKATEVGGMVIVPKNKASKLEGSEFVRVTGDDLPPNLQSDFVVLERAGPVEGGAAAGVTVRGVDPRSTSTDPVVGLGRSRPTVVEDRTPLDPGGLEPGEIDDLP